MLKAGQLVVANPQGKYGIPLPVTWKACDTIRVQADSLEEAYEWALEHSDEIPLGTEPGYVDGSYEIGSFEECKEYLSEAVDYSSEKHVREAHGLTNTAPCGGNTP